MNGLCNVNVELTDRCNKNCWMCGRRKRERENLKIQYGDMDFALVESIAQQLPLGIVVQLHNNGEALLYPQLRDAISAFDNQLTNIVTNGKLLVEKADEIIGNLDTMALSIIENDSEVDEQFDIFRQFVKLKGDKKPFIIFRIVGNVSKCIVNAYKEFKFPMTHRILHSPDGSFDYEQKPMIPDAFVDANARIVYNIPSPRPTYRLLQENTYP